MNVLLLFALLASPPGAQAAPQPSPLPVCDVKTFGAKGDGKTKDTAALQAAIESCAATGGTVRLHDGVFLSGMITLKSGIHLSIEPTATLKGTQDDSDYPDTHPPTDNSQLSNCRKALIYAEKTDNLTIDGGGTIDGNGNVAKWLGSAKEHPERTRPMAIYTTLSSHILIQNIHVKDAAMWAVVNLEADHLVIRGIDVHTPLSGTRDGIDIVDCHHVLIEDCTIYSEDDSICLKSGTAKGVYDVLVHHNHVLQSSVANGLKLGTASTGSFVNVTFEDNLVENTDKAAMAVESVDGAKISGVTFRRIQFHKTGSAVFILLGKRGNPPKVGSINGVAFEDITGDQMKHSWGSIISGTKIGTDTYKIRNVSFKNVRINHLGGLRAMPSEPPEYDGRYPDPNLWGDTPASAFYVRHVDGLSFDGNSPIEVSPPDVRPAMAQRDARVQPSE